MIKKLLMLLIISTLAIALGSSPLNATAGHAKGHVLVRLEDNGFDGTGGDFAIEVEQGQMVELTFEWSHKVSLGEEHIIILQGYNLETEKINAQHRDGTIKFIADKAGTFTFKCDLDCDVHDRLQRGHLIVKNTGSTATAARTASKLSLNPSDWTANGRSILFTAVLKDNQGNPISKALVHFYAEAEFVGTKGNVEIGAARTDENGVAFLDYRPTFDRPTQVIIAKFEGMGVYAESAQSIQIEESGPPAPAYTTAPMGLDDIRRAAPIALIAIVLSVWGTYAFVLLQVIGIFRLRQRR